MPGFIGRVGRRQRLYDSWLLWPSWGSRGGVRTCLSAGSLWPLLSRRPRELPWSAPEECRVTGVGGWRWGTQDSQLLVPGPCVLPMAVGFICCMRAWIPPRGPVSGTPSSRHPHPGPCRIFRLPGCWVGSSSLARSFCISLFLRVCLGLLCVLKVLVKCPPRRRP